jgi:hypothetical protein
MVFWPPWRPFQLNEKSNFGLFFICCFFRHVLKNIKKKTFFSIFGGLLGILTRLTKHQMISELFTYPLVYICELHLVHVFYLIIIIGNGWKKCHFYVCLHGKHANIWRSLKYARVIERKFTFLKTIIGKCIAQRSK